MLEFCFLIFVIALAHWYADFYCQTEEMALRKSTSGLWLAKHIVSYAWHLFAVLASVLFLFFLCTIMFGGLATTAFPLLAIILKHPIVLIHFVMINSLCHWVTDYYTSKWTSRLWKEGRIHDFFVVIGLDQLIHYTTFILSALIPILIF